MASAKRTGGTSTLDGQTRLGSNPSGILLVAPSVYLAVGLMAGALVALQIAILRIFTVAGWAHSGSLVVSLAMLGFGLAGAVMCIAKNGLQREWQRVTLLALLLFGPFMVVANLLAQQ